jgi:hypothetical protein
MIGEKSPFDSLTFPQAQTSPQEIECWWRVWMPRGLPELSEYQALLH